MKTGPVHAFFTSSGLCSFSPRLRDLAEQLGLLLRGLGGVALTLRFFDNDRLVGTSPGETPAQPTRLHCRVGIKPGPRTPPGVIRCLAACACVMVE